MFFDGFKIDHDERWEQSSKKGLFNENHVQANASDMKANVSYVQVFRNCERIMCKLVKSVMQVSAQYFHSCCFCLNAQIESFI